MRYANILLSIALLVTGTVVGLAFNWASDPETPESLPEQESSVQAQGLPIEDQGFTLISGEDALSDSDVDLQRDADRLLQGGNYFGALQRYRELSGGSRSNRADLQLRLGLSAELSGQLEESDRYYREIIRSDEVLESQKFFALVGTARVWKNQGRTDEAIELLSEIYLRYGHDGQPQLVREIVLRYLTDYLSEQVAMSVKDMAEWAPKFSMHGVPIELTLSTDLTLARSTQSTDADGIKVVQRPLDDVNLILVDAKLQARTLGELFMDLTNQSGIEFRASKEARFVLSGRSCRIHVSAMPISSILDQLLGSLDLLWSQEDSVVTITTKVESTQQMITDFKRARVQRLLRQHQLSGSEADRAIALLHDGNVSLMLSDPETAEDRFRSGLLLRPGGELSAMLFYNLAMANLRQDKIQPAIKYFYDALDQTLDLSMQAQAYGHIAALELKYGSPSKAIPAAARGTKVSNVPENIMKNAMLLAKAYLLEADPGSANVALFNQHELLKDSEHRRFASLIGTYARYLVVRPDNGLQDEGERLVLALAAIRPDDLHDFIDHLIIARAFRDAGFQTKSTEHLTLATEMAEGEYWDDRIRFELAKSHADSGSLDRAAAVLDQISAKPREDSLQNRMDSFAADIYFRLGKYDEAKKACVAILKRDIDEKQTKQTLSILGRCYQAEGQHRVAALCFAGVAPIDLETGHTTLQPTFTQPDLK